MLSLRQLSIFGLASVSALLMACTSSVSNGTNDGNGGGGGTADGSGGSGGGDNANCALYTTRPCTDPDGVSSTQQCIELGPDATGWTPCGPVDSSTTTASTVGTPLVLVFDDAPVDFTASSKTFALSDSMSTMSDWPSARTPWLALDRDGNGKIDDGSELFGSMTKLAAGTNAKNGFEALAELDSNKDGVIDAKDEGFSKLAVWADANGDRSSSEGEVSSASSRKIVSIDLAYTTTPKCDARGNCERETSTFVYLDESGAKKTGKVVDVWLKWQ